MTGPLQHRASALVARLTRAAAPADAAQAQLLAWSWLVSLPLLLTTGALYALGGLWGQAVLQWATMAAGVVVLACFARSGRSQRWSIVSVALGSLTFALGSLAQTPPDLSSVAWLGLAPLLASLMVPARQAVAWLLGEVALAAAVIALGRAGYHLADRDEQPGLTSTLNLALMFAVMALFGLHYRRRVEAQARAEAASRAKAAFLATVSHEIRTPMNGMLGMTELLLESEPSAERREQLRIVHRSGQVLLSLVDDILDFTRVETGKLVLLPEPVDLGQLVRDLEQLFRPLAAERGLRLVVRVPPSLPRVEVDGLRLRQVLSNLLANAIKFTPAGQVELTAELAEPGDDRLLPVAFSVTDTGVGIRTEDLPRLFQPFEQGDSATTRRHGGVGLGLAIARQLVSLLGGELTTESEPGRGSRFWFELELRAASAPAPAPLPGAGRPRPPGAGTGWPVLVVDDNPINLKVASALVSRAGYPVVTVPGGEEALRALREQPFAAVLMDCHMPDLDGLECSRRIQALEGPVARTPIIAVSASAAPDDVLACRAAGMCDFVSKPLSFATLTAALERHARAASGGPGAQGVVAATGAEGASSSTSA